MIPTKEEIYYLRSIYGNLREYRRVLPDETMMSIGAEALSDNIDWLDCYINKLERENDQ